MKNGKKIVALIIIILCALTAGVGVSVWNINKDSVKIPKVYFEGDISNMTSKEDKRSIKIKYRSEDKKFDTYAEIKIQGTSSIYYDKKNYTIALYEDEAHESKNKIVMNEEWGAQNKYCLKANWIDKTHSRNIVTARIGATIQEKYGLFDNTPHNGTIDGFPIEVYINKEFLGIYTWNIPKDEWLWNMDDENPNHIVIGAGSNGEITAFKEEITEFSDDGWEIEVGPENEETLNKFSRLIDFVKNSTDEEFKEDYELYLDKDAVLNYIAVVTFSEAIDNITKNMMLVTYDGKVWAPSLYDLDVVWGTDYKGKQLTDYEELEGGLCYSLLFDRTLECFPEEAADRYFELRKDILTKEYVMDEFESFKAQIPESSFEKEVERWGEIPGAEITQISDFLDFRISFVDKFMNNLYNVEK
ncbi:MAG: CotH kinase family protein [Clostridia bacterium]|nr:CotH kinase family protein [Clostridia bacterium]